MLKKQFKLSYKKVTFIPFQGNSERCKVLRSIYAQKILPLYHQGDIIYNVDESWIDVSDNRRRRWSRRGVSNTKAEKVLNVKINIITAISTEGNVYVALTQCNTDSDVMIMFMSRLAQLLSKESPGWRERSTFLLDGVSAIVFS